MNVTAGVCAPIKPTSLPLPVPKTKPLLHIKKGQETEPSNIIFNDISVSRSLNNSIAWEEKKRATGFCKMLVRAPRHGKMTSASTVGRSRCNQPSLRSYIDCFTTAGWTLDVCHFRAYKESVALAEIMPHSGGAKGIQGAGPYQSSISEPAQAKLFKKDLLYFILFSTCHRISRTKCLTRPLLHASSHLYTSKGCQHTENGAQDKSTSPINIIECI